MEKIIRLLYAEDDAEWAFSVQLLLEKKGFTVEVAVDGNDAWEKFQPGKYDMVLLDVDMPGKNGWELIEAFRIKDEWLPIVLYTAFFNSPMFVDAFGLGADDFIAKGGGFEIFADRLRAIYCRAQVKKTQASIFQISANTVFNAGSALLTINGKKKFLKSQSARLLELLCLRKNEWVSYHFLSEQMWSSENKEVLLKNYISELRNILKSDPTISIGNLRWQAYMLTISK